MVIRETVARFNFLLSGVWIGSLLLEGRGI
jgi:hypothetical protein